LARGGLGTRRVADDRGTSHVRENHHGANDRGANDRRVDDGGDNRLPTVWPAVDEGELPQTGHQHTPQFLEG
jgi:hypothetical protein